MSDVTRLTTILARANAHVVLAAGIASSANADLDKISDTASLQTALRWFAECPYPHVVARLTPCSIDNLKAALPEMTLADWEDTLYLLRAFVPADQRYTRTARREVIDALFSHKEVSGLHEARPCPAEFAALDAATSSGYYELPNTTNRIKMYCDIGIIRDLRAHRTQMHGSLISFSCDVDVDGRCSTIITPYCLSRESAMVYLSVVLTDYLPAINRAVQARRVTTATSRLSRMTLTQVRDALDMARTILKTYKFNPQRLEFVDDGGSTIVSARSRGVAPALALSYRLGGRTPEGPLRGSVDVLLRMALARTEALTRAHVALPPEYAVRKSLPDALLRQVRSLWHDRHVREALPTGPETNKRPGLGLVARGSGTSDRNTDAALSRLEEVVASRRDDVRGMLLVLEWAGMYDPSTVVAAALLHGVDIAVDAGVPSEGERMGGVNVPAGYGRYMCFATTRLGDLPVSSEVIYPAGTPLTATLSLLASQFQHTHTHLGIVRGGIAANRDITPLASITDTAGAYRATADAQMALPVRFFSSEILLPVPTCPHAGAPFDSFVRAKGALVSGCASCTGVKSAITMVYSLLKTTGRLVKQRAAYGHNTHYTVEVFEGMDPGDRLAQSVAAIDAAVRVSHARNTFTDVDAASPDLQSPAFGDLMMRVRQSAYEALIGTQNVLPPIADGELESIAASI
uniref:Uncharacterized protein n=1 Tax=Sclerotinia sclerotiorum tetramycovirus-1 TaxID=2231775 RepID=A0A2Z4QKA1_9VIRU|nr:hypothetical protein [Sclerotinia sclerotiorum tetramycovirus-1]